MKIPKYRICSTVPIHIDSILRFFDTHIEASLPSHWKAFRLNDGNKILLKPAGQDDYYLVEYQCLLSFENQVLHFNLEVFQSFCETHYSDIESLSSGTVIPPETGSILDDILRSRAYQLAHQQLKDKKRKW